MLPGNGSGWYVIGFLPRNCLMVYPIANASWSTQITPSMYCMTSPLVSYSFLATGTILIAR